jgi:hypothetical protein
MPRNPLGVYVRQTPDWFIKRCATVGGFYDDTHQNSITFDLFNDATDGSNLHVYKIWINNGGNDGTIISGVQGHSPTLMANSSSVVIGGPQLPGTMYYDLTAGVPYVSNVAKGGRFVYDDVSALWNEFSVEGPIIVIPPGYSLRHVTPYGGSPTSGGITLGMSYFWAVLPDQG